VEEVQQLINWIIPTVSASIVMETCLSLI
jgi:hypothetical protein